MTEPTRPDRPRMPPQAAAGSPLRGVLAVLVLVIAAFLGWRLWGPQTPGAPPAPTAPAAAPPPAVSAPAGATGDAPAPAEPRHPVAAAAEPAGAGGSSLDQALADLLGNEASRALIRERLVLRVVATVDNLARSHAPARMWPVAPTPGRFQVHQSDDGAAVVAQGNAERYSAFVALAESVDPAALAGLYARFYPLFQDAYAEIGFPGRHFNDRLVEVIDHLLATPRPALPLAVRLVEVRSETPSTRPWVRYEFADPALERLSAGQKILLRVGAENRRRLESVLSALRRQVADGALTRAR